MGLGFEVLGLDAYAAAEGGLRGFGVEGFWGLAFRAEDQGLGLQV